MDGNKKDHAPVISVPSDEQTEQLAKLREQVKTLDGQAEAVAKQIDYQDPFAAGVPGDLKRKTIVWVDDEAPKNAQFGGEKFEWVTAEQGPVHSGKRAMKRDSEGNEQHFFSKCDEPLRVGPGDKLFAWVYLDPDHMPKEIMLQYHSSNWLHRAYWGENLIPYGKDNSTQRKRMGNLPEAGKWVKLEVDAGAIGIEPGTVLTGMAFTQYDGVSYWDEAGVETLTSQEPVDFAWIDDDLPAGAEPHGDGKTWQWVGSKDHPVHSGLRALRRSGGDGLNQDYFLKAKPLQLHADDQLFAYVYLDPDNPPKSVQLQFNNGSWDHRVRWGTPAHGADRKNGADYVASETIPETGRWVRLQVDLGKVGLKPDDKLVGWAFTQVGGTVYWDTAGVNTYNAPDDRHLKSLLVWEQRYGDDKDTPAPIRKIIDIPAEKRTDAQRHQLAAYYVRYVHEGSRDKFDKLNEQIDQVRQQVDQVEKDIPTTLVMKERPEPRQAWVLKRGQYDQHGDEVQRITPAALPPMADGLPRNRLGFAKWLVDPKHPLTARVAVNRMWQQCFGTGIVETSEDFGSQGSPPSHPELLDWLAVQFVADGWDMKRFMKRVVMSATYRQSSVISPRKLEVDPLNRLLARGPRFRLDAESLRDQALAISGLLVDKLYGPPVKPPQPEGIWEAVGYTRSNTAKFKPDSGADIYRRSVYSFWKRTAPPPPMTTFDAPSREACTMRRERTNTPLQALLLMNEIEYVEAARNLAQRAMLEVGESPEQRAAFMFMLATAHAPSAEQATIMLDAYRDHLKAFERDASAAKQLVEYGQSEADPKLDATELAAWTMVGNLVLNFDQTLNKN
ncbi:DUF1553 domain-containing protein [Planctomycetales bacterium ZRK34]|nr:DUF1553 domain-containing protein [Planctomycetales bacterium ZRK34]